jgi:hypothetical protein
MVGGKKMLNDRNEYLAVPISIELLFENEKLELMKVLCLIYSISLNSKRYAPISEIVFYFALVNFNLVKIFEDIKTPPALNLFFRFQSRISNIIIYMENLKFIDLKANLSTKTDDIKIRISNSGKEFYKEHNSVFFQELQDKYISTFEKVNYNITNLKILKEGKS